jgi:acetyl esterase/lipase
MTPSSHLLPVDEQRAGMASGAEPELPHAVTDEIAGVPVRILEPDDFRGTYLHIHGGGWTMGSNAFQDHRLWRVATAAGVRVVSVDYRLAPEHPFPGCLDDCLAVAERLTDGPTVIGGESAGAHLSVLVLTRLRTGFRGAILGYGCYDLGMSRSQRTWGERQVILSTPIIRWHIDQLLPGLAADARRDPSISPLFADLSGLPPALMTVGTEDPMLDDSVELAAKWPGATLEVYPGGFHAFDLFPIRIGEIANQRQIDYVRRCINDD